MGLPQYKACNELNVYNPIHVLTATKQSLRKANSAFKGKKGLDNPLLSHSSTIEYLKALNSIFLYRRKRGITSEGMELLIYCYLVFKESNEGITSRRICRDYNWSGNSDIQATRAKLKRLSDKGYLLDVGKTVCGAALYIPSVKAIEDIEGIFK